MRHPLPEADVLRALYYYDAESGNVFRKEKGKGPNAEANDLVGWYDGKGYLNCRVAKQAYKLHRVIWTMVNGSIPDDMVIDHINGIKDDNRLANLRIATLSENGHNCVKKYSSSGEFKGITYHTKKKRWEAEISVDNERFFLGGFKTAIEASEAYERASVEAFGEFHKDTQSVN